MADMETVKIESTNADVKAVKVESTKADAEKVKIDKIESTNGDKPEEKEVFKAERDPSQEEDNDSQSDLTKLERDIIRQIEYYFSESNMRRDKFLNQKAAENEEKWIDISVLLTFNRLKAITEDVKVITDALEKSTHGTVQISEDRLKLRRHPENPFPEFNETRRKETQARTAYAKGFPLDSDLTTLIDFFHDNFEGVEQVSMRKYFEPKSKNYLFKGSVFITFKTRELAEAFVAQPELKYKEKDLLRYSQAKYIEAKRKEREEFEKKKKAKQGGGDDSVIERDQFILPKAAVVKFTVAEAEGEISREDIKARIAELDSSLEVAYVNFQKGDKEGFLRFSKENDGVKFIEKLGGDNVSKPRFAAEPFN